MSKPGKLTLTRETIQSLHRSDIAGVQGGTSPVTTVSVIGEAVATAGIVSARACWYLTPMAAGQAAQGFPIVTDVVKVGKAAVNSVKRAETAVNRAVTTVVATVSRFCR
jgi:hypothetical protein